MLKCPNLKITKNALTKTNLRDIWAFPFVIKELNPLRTIKLNINPSRYFNFD